MKKILFLIALLVPLNAYALQIPRPSPGDSRIRYVYYDPANVVKVVAHYGYQTFILFASNEIITDLGAGDSKAYDIGIAEKKNAVFIKPKAESPYTNITVVTNKRHYNFDLKLVKHHDAETYYMIQFLYPDDDVDGQIARSKKSIANNLLKTASDRKKKNYDYWAQGSDSLTPVEAWDDGLFTYMRFAPNKEFPAIFIVNEDKTESLLNTNVDDDVIVVQRVARKFALRKGDLVTCVYNKNFDPVGVPKPSKTVSPDVRRVIKKRR